MHWVGEIAESVLRELPRIVVMEEGKLEDFQGPALTKIPLVRVGV